MKGKINRILLITGLSGSGKSSALHTLEDLGFYCIDNLSPTMAIDIIKSCTKTQKDIENIAISIDIRSLRMNKNIPDSINKMYEFFIKENIAYTTIFLHSSSQTIISRYNATRRLHPLTSNKQSLSDSIIKEKDIMQYLKEKSTIIIDTDNLTPITLKENILNITKKIIKKNDILIQIQSFGFKNDIPNDSDFVFDVRCLRNPFWNKKLRNLNGKNKSVSDYLGQDPLSRQMQKDILMFLTKWIIKFQKNDRSYLTISIGCTGGQHRSVFIVEMLYKELKKKYNDILIKHRDLR
tara:strand:- start:1109 stop:1990 length:882 start_codon:yes stop_codon:yes gene_type:complete